MSAGTTVSSRPRAVSGELPAAVFQFAPFSPTPRRACYIAVPLYICGFVTLGASIEKHLSVGALVMGWGIAEFAVMINTVAVYAYCNDSFPKHQGEISALINLARTLGGASRVC